MKTAEQRLAELSIAYSDAQDELLALRTQLDGDIPKATFWLQTKVHAQRAALDTLNRKVVTQLFVLRTLDGLGRSLTVDEYRQARDRVADEQLRERIDEA